MSVSLHPSRRNLWLWVAEPTRVMLDGGHGIIEVM